MGVAASIRRLEHRYPDRTQVALCGADLVIGHGERVALLGANGSGKTTVLSHLFGLKRPSGGEVRLLGVDPSRHFSKVRGRVGVMFQNVTDQIVGPTVRDDIGLTPRCMGLSRAEVAARVERAAERTGITQLLDRLPHYLSGGEQKKVALAGALAMEPDILVLDEPLEGLDTRARREIVEVLQQYCTGQRSVVFSTHDFSAAAALADKVYLIGGRRVVAEGPVRRVLSDLSLLEYSGLEPPALVLLADLLRRGGIDVEFDPDPVKFGASLLAEIAGSTRTRGAGVLPWRSGAGRDMTGPG